MSNSAFVAWCSDGDPPREWGPVGRLERLPSGFRFVYTRGAQELKGFHPFPGMEDVEAVYGSDDLFPLFANRLLAPSRPEYRSFLEWCGFDPSEPPDPIALLGTTEGPRTTDRLEILPGHQPDGAGVSRTKFFLHGLRRLPQPAVERIGRLCPGERLGLQPDLPHLHDLDAVAVRTIEDESGYLIGHVPRYLAHDLRELRLASESEVTRVTVERVNRNAPLQFRLLYQLEARWPTGFQPRSSGRYQPLPEVSLENGGPNAPNGLPSPIERNRFDATPPSAENG